jgi:hypothetical protein
MTIKGVRSGGIVYVVDLGTGDENLLLAERTASGKIYTLRVRGGKTLFHRYR